MNRFLLSALLASLYASSASAHGETHYKPKIKGFGGYGDINLIAASNYDSDLVSEEYNEISTHSHADLYYNFNDTTSVNAALQLAHIHEHHHGDTTPSDDKLFQEHGLQLKELYLQHKMGKANIYAGKITPVVAFDYHDYPIVWAHEAAEEYAVEQKIGAGFGYQMTENQSINISTFFSDTTFLSDTAFYSESGNVDEDDGGSGNTEALNNFALNYRINIPELNDMLFNLGYAFQKQGRTGQDDENMLAAGIKKNFSIGEEIDLDVIAELVNELNSGGTTGRTITYKNIGTRLNHGKAFFATNITDKDSSSAHHRKKFYNFAVGYEVMEDTEASIGWKADDAKGERTESVLFTLSYRFNICPCEQK